MAIPGSRADGKALMVLESTAERSGERSELVRTPVIGTASVQAPPLARSRAQLEGHVYLFIYRVRHNYDAYAWVDNIRYCTVFAFGRTFAEAERIAINCVHQHGWRILKTDTATAFATERFTGEGTDAAHVANLADFGVSFKLNH
jgi:hypothetical protein